MPNKKRSCTRFILIGMAFLASLCLVLTAVSGYLNRKLPAQSSVVDRLSADEKARLAEVFHLRETLGDQVLPGWAQADIPLIAYNEAYLFLVGCQEPAPGWRKVPSGAQMGREWEAIQGDDFYGQVYYRQRLLPSGETTQAFTVQVGDRWVASLPNFEWSRISMANAIRQDVPAALQPIFPYFLAVNLMIPGSDAYVSLFLHEAVHAYQGIRAPARLAAAERSSGQFSARYPWEHQTFRDAWQVELDLLNKALRAQSPEETLRLARAFLEQRTLRRQAANLTGDLIDFERQREWEEGIAKYGERSIYLQAAQEKTYQPVAEILDDSEFHQYRQAQQKWDQEVDQIRRMAGDEGDGRFYYSGFAQAVLLDRLSPGWKQHLFEEGVWLENLLIDVIGHP